MSSLPVTVGPRHVTIEVPTLPALYLYVYFCVNERANGGFWTTSILYENREKRDEAMRRGNYLCAYPVDLPAQPPTPQEPKP
jgi:hypothetical protein